VKVVFFTGYVVMAVWLLIAGALRLVLLLSAGLPLDPLPFISGGIAVLALLLVAPRGIRRFRRSSRGGGFASPLEPSGPLRGGVED